MDRKIIKQYGAGINCFRIRTARQKKRMQYEDHDKWLIKLEKEENELYHQRRNLGWMELIPPVQKGWKRFFVLREDVARSRHAEFFENILKKINTYDWHYRKDFKVKRRRYGRKTYVVKGQGLSKPDRQDFEKLGFSENEKRFFHLEYHYLRWSDKPYPLYVFNEPWRFVLRVRPNMIDKIRIKDPVLEARIKWISDHLEENGNRGRLTKIMGGGYKWYEKGYEEKYDEENPLKNKPLHRILDELKYE
ncbi:MAG TPA: hypothetical protein VE035_10910 [Puia sp.]|nr:hypothetical protein [Puia sp.]